MANFPTTVAPSYSASKISRPNTRTAQFAGYSQRSTFGINQNLKIWNFNWNNLSDTDADEIETFLDARAGVENFDYTAPGESSSSKYICREWSRVLPYANLSTITASFEQVAEA